MKTLIFGGHVVDPANRVNSKLNLLIEDGKISCFAPHKERYGISGSYRTLCELQGVNVNE